MQIYFKTPFPAGGMPCLNKILNVPFEDSTVNDCSRCRKNREEQVLIGSRLRGVLQLLKALNYDLCHFGIPKTVLMCLTQTQAKHMWSKIFHIHS